MIILQRETYPGATPWGAKDPDDTLNQRHPITPCTRCGMERKVRKGSGTGLCRDCLGWAKRNQELGIWT